MKQSTITWPLLLISLVATIVSGCVGLSTDLLVYDKIPENMPKGYVEFFTEENEDAVEINKEFPGSYFLYLTENGIEKEVEGMVWSWRTKRRVAVNPGQNTFRIKYASVDTKITVEARENMITPVRIVFKRLGESYRVHDEIKQKFNMDIKVEKANNYTAVK